MGHHEIDQKYLEIHKKYVAEHGLSSLWMENWSSKPCRDLFSMVAVDGERMLKTLAGRSPMHVCPDCGLDNVQVGSSWVHAGYPLLALLGDK